MEQPRMIDHMAPPIELELPITPSEQPSRAYMALKRAVDIVLSFLAVVFLSPVFLLISLLIRLEDGGKAFYVHERVGMYGTKLRLLKFRSMREGADNLEDMLTPEEYEEFKQEFKLTNDPRVTKIGQFLRKTSLDELPQFFNVLAGDLSLVGPRPITTEELSNYKGAKDQLLSVKPGLTGYWQVYARNDVGYEDGSRQRMELYYCANRNAFLDVKIFFKTFEAVITMKGQ